MTTRPKKKLWAYLNGEFVPVEQVHISALDRGFLLGDGIFETMRSYRGKPFLLDKHVRRLSASAKALNIKPVPSLRKMRGTVEKLLEHSDLQDAYIRITLSRGRAEGLGLVETTSPTLFIFARPLEPYPKEWYREGVRVIVSKVRRNTTSPVLQHKTLSYLESLWARDEAGKRGAQEALFLNTDGHIAEGATTNIFFVEKRRVFTPALETNILPGVTREVVLEICESNHIPYQEGLFTLDDLNRADEAFLTNALMDIMPVRMLGSTGFRISPRTLTSRIAREYARFCSSKPFPGRSSTP